MRISRASDDDKNGPFLVVDISLQKIEVDIAGFAYCLGISAEIRVIINSTHFYFHIEGDMFTVFRANLTVAAVYGGTLADMEYDVGLKSDSHFPKKKFLCFNNSPSKIMKNAFYFILKAVFFLKIFKVLSWLFGHVEKTTWFER